MKKKNKKKCPIEGRIVFLGSLIIEDTTRAWLVVETVAFSTLAAAQSYGEAKLTALHQQAAPSTLIWRVKAAVARPAVTENTTP